MYCVNSSSPPACPARLSRYAVRAMFHRRDIEYLARKLEPRNCDLPAGVELGTGASFARADRGGGVCSRATGYPSFVWFSRQSGQ
eukprot:gene12657-biopygen1930